MRLLVETDDVPRRIPKPGGNFRSVDADGLHDLASVGYDRVHGGGDAVNHDVNEQTGLWRRRPTGHPGAADLTDSVVEGGLPVTSLSETPAEDGLVEGGGTTDVPSRNLHVADLTVSKRRRH